MAGLERIWYPASRPTLWQTLAAAPLSVLSVLYGAAVAIRNWLYDRRVLKAHRVEGLTVISVGNINVGGTGKTPAVIHLANALASLGKRVAVLSRGYGRKDKEDRVVDMHASVDVVGDEPLLIARRCPQVSVLVGADRAVLAQRAQQSLGAEVVLLDDGFQHRRLYRDADILVVDADAGFGNEKLLPRGPLREPLTAISRATVLWVKGNGQGDRAAAARCSKPEIQTQGAVDAVVDPQGHVHSPHKLRDTPVFAFAGIARPERFVRTLEAMGASVVGTRFFADHHRFSEKELESLAHAANQHHATLVTTEKDWVRLSFPTSAWHVRWGTRIHAGEDHLRALLRSLGLASELPSL